MIKILFGLFFPVLLFGQTEYPVEVYVDKTDLTGFKVMGKNEGIVPFTVILTIKGDNLGSDVSFPHTIVLFPKDSARVMATIFPIDEDEESWSYEIGSEVHFGNITNVAHDDNYVYRIPFKVGEQYQMTQGYNGKHSHQGQNAVDFTMPKGTKVCAAREGIVIDVKENSGRGCNSRRCLGFANYITILHDDGSMANYAHLQKHGSLVEVGERVEKGQEIGLSGNTGWTTGPHLHFVVYTPTKESRRTIPTKFWVGQQKAAFLKEGSWYAAINQ